MVVLIGLLLPLLHVAVFLVAQQCFTAIGFKCAIKFGLQCLQKYWDHYSLMFGEELLC